MESFIGYTHFTLSEAENFPEIFELVRKNQIVTGISNDDSSISLLLSNGKLLKYYTSKPRAKVIVESHLSSLVPSEIHSGLISENFPCFFHLGGNSLLYMKSSKDIHTATIRDITTSNINLQFQVKRLVFNLNKKAIIAHSEKYIQVIVLNSNSDPVSFAPFTSAAPVLPCENSVLFSKRYSNLFYYLDRVKEVTPECIQFSPDACVGYVIKKCIVDSTEISESRINLVSFDTDIVSMDINLQEQFVFVTQDKKVHTLRGNKIFTSSIPTTEPIRKVRWDYSNQIIIVQTEKNTAYFLDFCLNTLAPTLELPRNALFSEVSQVQVSSSHVFFLTPVNVALFSFLNFHSNVSLVTLHLFSDNFAKAIQCLELIPQEKEFNLGFTQCWNYVMRHLEVELVKSLDNIWTKYCHSKLNEPMAKKLMIRLGYQLMYSGNLEPSFLLAKKIKSVRLLNDLAYYAHSKGMKGISVLAKHERQQVDESYVHPKQQLENLVKATGKQLDVEDYGVLLGDLEEVTSIGSLADAVRKGGYIEERNFWEIDLEEYAQALELEGRGKYEDALEIYKRNSLTQEINRINLMLEHSKKGASAFETILHMEEIENN